MDDKFFDIQREQSEIKAEIVSKYFWTWAKIIIPTAKKSPKKKIAYIDLFAGPGRYKDGSKSTPIMVLETAISDPDISQMLVTIFNDMNPDSAQNLEQTINQIPNIQKLKYQPDIRNFEVGEQIVQMFESMSFVPTLFFVDPWGYKGLSLRLVNSVLKDWGCDCIFFFNYNRINMGLNNSAVEQHMNALFGDNRASKLRHELEGINTPEERELHIVNELAQALRDMGGKYVLPFRFKDENGRRTSHHLIFVSKHFKGYDVMKGIMAKASSSEDQGVASFEYNQASERQPMLFGFVRPLDELKINLPNDLAGQTISMKDIYERHSIDTPYVRKNYVDVLNTLEAEKLIIVYNSKDPQNTNKRQKDTFADHLIVTFPPKE